MPAPKPVYAIVGKDPYLQTRALATLLEQFKGDVDRCDIDPERAQFRDVLDEVRSFAMFGGHKLVVLRDADQFISDHREKLEAYLSAPSSGGTLVLRVNSLPATQRIHKAIAKVGQILPCEPPKLTDLPAWIIRHAKSEHNAVIAPDAAALLSDLIGTDMGRIDNELAKLAIMSGDGRISMQTVSSGVAFQRDQEMWKLTDMLCTGNVPGALGRWRQLLQTDPAAEFKAAIWLTLWIQKLPRVRAMAAQGVRNFDIGRTLKIWPAENVDGLLRLANRLGDSGIRRAMEQLVQADLRSKSGLGDAQTNVESFLLSLAG